MVKPSPDRAAQGRANGTQAIERALEIVRVVARIQRSGANLTRITRETGLNITTTLRILRSLTENRLLRHDPVEQNYYVGPLAFELGLAAPEEAQIQTQWRDTIEQIARETHLTTYLIARSGNEGVCLLCVQGSSHLRAVPLEVGQRTPLGVGSPNLAILAALEDEEIARIVAALGPRVDLVPDGAPKPEPIQKRIQITRERGFALANRIPGITGIGVAVTPHDGITTLGISVAAVTSTLGQTDAGEIAAVVSAAIRRRQMES